MLLGALPPAAQRRLRLLAGRPVARRISLSALDDELERVADLFARSEDAARAHLAGFELAPPANRPDDPFSAAYEEWTWELYRAVSGRTEYSVAHEASPFDLEAAVRRPFPCSTGSAAVVGEDLEARAYVLRALGAGPLPGAGDGVAGIGLQPPARIVELGPGWGNLTADLVATGFEVTAVEVDPRFCSLLSTRVPDGGRLTVCQADMLSFLPDQPMDAAVFYESFHHCADHRRLLDRLHQVVKPAGAVVFAGEPVQKMPFPWGPRLDGLSLWSTRTYGWLELGFDPGYFATALARAGWRAVHHRARRNPKADVYVARATSTSRRSR